MSEFYKDLLEFAKLMAEHHSDEGDEGQPGYWLKLQKLKPITSNYPWLYVDYLVQGSMEMTTLEQAKSCFEDFCRTKGAQFLSLTFAPRTNKSFHARFRLTYREDLQPGFKGYGK